VSVSSNERRISYPPPLTLAPIHAEAITAKPSRKGTRQELITPNKTTTPSVSKVSAKAPGGAALRRVAPRLFFHLEQFKISSIYESLTNWTWI